MTFVRGEGTREDMSVGDARKCLRGESLSFQIEDNENTNVRGSG